MAAQAEELGLQDEANQAKALAETRSIDRQGDTAGAASVQPRSEKKDKREIRDSYEIMGCTPPRREEPRLDMSTFPSGLSPNISPRRKEQWPDLNVISSLQDPITPSRRREPRPDWNPFSSPKDPSISPRRQEPRQDWNPFSSAQDPKIIPRRQEASIDLSAFHSGRAPNVLPHRHNPRPDLNPSPAGQAPDIPLPPDPSYLAARGLSREILSEPSLYDRTEKLLELSRTRERLAEEIDAHTEELAEEARIQHEKDDRSQEHAESSRMQSEFGWFGNKGKSSFRDLSAKEIRQLQDTTSHRSGQLDRSGEPEDAEAEIRDEMLRRTTESVRLNETMTLTPVTSRRVPELVHAAPPRSSQEVIFDNTPEDDSRRETPFRPGLYMDSDSLASLVGDKHAADAERLDALREGRHVIRSQNRPERFYAIANEHNLVKSAEVSEDEDVEAGEDDKRGPRKASHITRPPRNQTLQIAIDRDISGSSLADLSSEESDGERSKAITPWGPLVKNPAFITPPAKSFTHKRQKAIDQPAAVPEFLSADSTTKESQRGNPLSATSTFPTPLLPTTPQRQVKAPNNSQNPHLSPQTFQPNPFLTTPTSPDTDNSGLSFGFSDSSKSPTARYQRSAAPRFRSSRTRNQDQDEAGDSFELSDLSKSPTSRHQRSAASPPTSPTSRHRKVRIPPVRTHRRLGVRETPPTRAEIYAERRREQRAEQRRQVTFVEPDAASQRSSDGSYKQTIPTHISVDGNIILNPELPHEPKSLRSVTQGSIRKTKDFLTPSPRGKSAEFFSYFHTLTCLILALGNMAESRRYQRIREEMGCGTGGVTRVPGMQAIANSRVDPDLVSDLGFFRPSSFSKKPK